MSNRFRMSQSTPWKLDIVGAGLGLLIAALLFPLQLFVSSIFISTIPAVIGIASGLYLITQRYESRSLTTDQWRLSDDAGHVIQMFTLIAFAGTVYIATLAGGRTVPFLAAATVVSMLVFAQIMFLRQRALTPRAALAQILALALLVRGVALVSTPGFIGVDAWVHITDYANAIAGTGDLSAIAGTKYYSAPLYHLFVVAAGEALGTTLRTALYATFGLVMPLALLLVYYTTRLFFSVRWALFATAVYSVSDHVIRWSLHIIPTSVGLVFFLGVCYGIGRIYVSERSLPMYGLVVLFGVATILTHQVSTFILLIFLAAGAAAQLYTRFFRSESPGATTTDGRINFVGLFFLLFPLTLANWSLAPATEGSFLQGMLRLSQRRLASAELLNLASITQVDTGPIESVMMSVPIWVQIVNTAGFLILLLVALLGSFTLLQRQQRELLSLSWVSTSALMLGITLGLPLLGLYFLLPNRWFAFMYFPMVVLGAHGVRYLELKIRPRHFAIAAVAFILVFPGAMLVTEHATRDNPVFEQYHTQYAYSEAELDAAQTIDSIHPAGAPIQADHPYRLLFRDWQHQSTESFTLTEDGRTTGEYVVYRQGDGSESTLAEFRGAVVSVRLPPDNVCRPSMDVAYTNGKVMYCRGGAL